MDWAAVHSYAEEIELWSSLTINVWVLSTALVVAVKWLTGHALTRASIAHSAKIGIAMLPAIISIVGAFAGTGLGGAILNLWRKFLSFQ